MIFPLIPPVSTTPPVYATGGIITTNGPWRVHTFTALGASTFQAVGGPSAFDLEYLVVAGGGGGGGSNTGSALGGGGGAGGMLEGTLSLGAGTYQVAVGGPGGGGSYSQGYGGEGGASAFDNGGPKQILTRGGGGGGWCYWDGSTYYYGAGGQGGGSGGGRAYDTYYGSGGGGGTPGQGNDGGSSVSGGNGSGGGGKGSAGAYASTGGVGKVNSIDGNATTYAAGGYTTGIAGASSRGNGGGGGYNSNGSQGGSGIVIVRYRGTTPQETVGGNDYYTSCLLHLDSNLVDSSMWQRGGWGQNGNVTIDTTQSKFGGASARFVGNGYMYAATDIAAFGTGDFAIDFWVRFASIGSQIIYDGRGTGSDLAPVIYLNAAGNVLEYFVGGTLRQSTFSPVANTWYHVAVTRNGTVGRLFVNGVQQGATFSDINNFAAIASRPLVGTAYDGSSSPVNGWVEELRITKGKPRWTANFTPPTAPYS